MTLALAFLLFGFVMYIGTETAKAWREWWLYASYWRDLLRDVASPSSREAWGRYRSRLLWSAILGTLTCTWLVRGGFAYCL